jgi:hypothetical protein
MLSKISSLALLMSVGFLNQGLAQGLIVPNPTGNNNLDVTKLANDKEETSLVLGKKQIRSLLNHDKQKVLTELLYSSVLKVKTNIADNTMCDLGLIDHFFEALEKHNFEISRHKVISYLHILRANNSIDDIFLKLLLDLSKLKFDLIAVSDNDKKPSAKVLRSTSLFENNNVETLYQNFKVWPDEEKICSLGAWARLKSSAKVSKTKNLLKDLKSLNAKAYLDGVITLDTYQRLEFLRKSNIWDRKIFLGGYLNKSLLAKNSLIPVKAREYQLPVENEERFASKKIALFKDLTRREALYQKYNNDQIVVLADILRKASLRMGVDPAFTSSIPVIVQEFRYQDERGEYVTIREEYELENAADQYNYARKRMRLDIFKTNSFNSFAGLKITYEEVIMAALETGYITHEEVEMALIYDDLWNKEKSKLAIALQTVWGIGSTAVFFLPPPYNIIGGIGVALINSNIIYKKDGADNDHPASLFN